MTMASWIRSIARWRNRGVMEIPPSLPFRPFVISTIPVSRSPVSRKGSVRNRLLPGFPEAEIEEFLVTILSEANVRMVKKSFQGAKGNLGNTPQGIEIKGQWWSPGTQEISFLVTFERKRLHGIFFSARWKSVSRNRFPGNGGISPTMRAPISDSLAPNRRTCIPNRKTSRRSRR